MRNLAGHPVAIFLYRFLLRKNAISFVLNESIAEDMYPDIGTKLQPLIHACCETLLRYQAWCRGDTIMDGNILLDGGFEVMLSPGLGQHFVETEKQNLFQDAHTIANLLMDVMARRTQEEKLGNYPGPQPVVPKIARGDSTHPGLQALGRKKRRAAPTRHTPPPKLSVQRLTPDDLPPGVVAKPSYDHRGHCLAFEHATLGELGKIVLIGLGAHCQLEAELLNGPRETFEERRALLDTIVGTIEDRLNA